MRQMDVDDRIRFVMERNNLVLQRDRLAVVLKAIVDCYFNRNDSSPKTFCNNAHEHLVEGRKLLADFDFGRPVPPHGSGP